MKRSLSAAFLVSGACTTIAAAQTSARDALLQTEQAVARRSAEAGPAAALEASGTDDLVLLISGAPVMAGRAGAAALIAAQPSLQGTRVQWQPMHLELSNDSQLASSWGVLIAAPPSGPLRVGRYIAGWRRGTGGEWQLAAMLWIGPVIPPGATVLSRADSAPAPTARQIPPRAEGIATTENAFSARAARVGFPLSFHENAHADGVLFGPGGMLLRGPDAIRRGLGPEGPPNPREGSLIWGPVIAEATTAGDLGWTISEGMASDSTGITGHTKYMTVWKRTPRGYRFLVDGGNSRPRPAEE